MREIYENSNSAYRNTCGENCSRRMRHLLSFHLTDFAPYAGDTFIGFSSPLPDSLLVGSL